MSTDRQLERMAVAIDSQLSEFLDGHVVVGFLDGRPIITRSGNDAKTHLALNQLLLIAAASVPGGSHDG